MTGEQNMVEAISRLIAEWGRGGRLQVEFKRDIQSERMDSLLQGNIFRIVQEALTNVKKSGDRRSKRTGGGAEFGPTWARQRATGGRG